MSRWLAAVIMKGISLPENVNQRLPLLEQRVNGFALKAFRFLRWTIMAVTLFFVLDIIGAIDLRSWLASQIGFSLTSTLASVLGIVVVAVFFWLAVTSWIDYRLNPDFGEVPTARETTLLSLFRNAATVTVIVLTLMFCLSELGLNIGPLLASAGVLGLAIGFGAQKMVQDIITGIFIQLENSIDVGDIITVGGITGGVEKLSVRSVSLRDVNGIFHIIPFSTVDMVSNFSRDFSYYVCDMGVAYREDLEDVKSAMFESYDILLKNHEVAAMVRDQIEWMGVEAFGDSAVVVRVRLKTVPGRQFVVGRAYNEVLKRVFDERGIEIPFPHQTLYLGEAKDGSTQTFKVSLGET
jgi:small-conductance mechanosensitive channel